MFFSDWRLLLRRWYVVVVGLLATLALCFLASRFVPTKYEANAGILLLPPPSTAEGVPDNPFLSLGGLDTVSAVVARAATDRAMQQEVAKAGGTGSYTVEPDVASGGPVLLITVDDVTSAGTLTTLRVVSQRVPSLLTNLQTSSGVRENALIRSRELIRDNVAQPVRKPLIRAMLVALAAGLAGTVLVTSLVDGFLTRRTRGRADPEPEPAVGGEPPPPAPDSWSDDPGEDDQPRWVDERRQPEHRRDPIPRAGARVRADEGSWSAGPSADAWAEAAAAWADGVHADQPHINGSRADAPAAGPNSGFDETGIDSPTVISTAADLAADRPADRAGMNGIDRNGHAVNGNGVDGNGTRPGADVRGVNGHSSRSATEGRGVNGNSVNGTGLNGNAVNGHGVEERAVEGVNRHGVNGAVDGREVPPRGVDSRRDRRGVDGSAVKGHDPVNPRGHALDGRGGPARRVVDRSMPWWASPTDPDPTEEIVYDRGIDQDPTVEIAYDRLAASLRKMQDENRHTEPD